MYLIYNTYNFFFSNDFFYFYFLINIGNMSISFFLSVTAMESIVKNKNT